MSNAEFVCEIAQPLTDNASNRRKATRARVHTPKAVAKHHRPLSWISHAVLWSAMRLRIAFKCKELLGVRVNDVHIQAGRQVLFGNLAIPENAVALVLFAHGSGSSRHSPRNQFVARTLNRAGLGTLLFDLLTPEEEALDVRTHEHRFNIGLLAERLMDATKWTREEAQTHDLRIGYFGSSTGGAAALVAAAELPQDVGAVVSRGGRPDLAGDALPRVQAATLLIVGGNDDIVIELNDMARDQMRCEVKLEIIRGATHLFEEPGALENVAELARAWFTLQLSDPH
jgi:dienelactone hydrolase